MASISGFRCAAPQLRSWLFLYMIASKARTKGLGHVNVLQSMCLPKAQSGIVFPGRDLKPPLSNMRLTAVLRRMGRAISPRPVSARRSRLGRPKLPATPTTLLNKLCRTGLAPRRKPPTVVATCSLSVSHAWKIGQTTSREPQRGLHACAIPP
jgi:hypothetical protein